MRKQSMQQLGQNVEKLALTAIGLGHSACIRYRDGRIYLYTELALERNRKFLSLGKRLFPGWYVTRRHTGTGYGINYRLV